MVASEHEQPTTQQSTTTALAEPSAPVARPAATAGDGAERPVTTAGDVAGRPDATAGDIAELLEPLRREILAHCYRMTGSVHDAEDLVQETYLRAWRAFHGFENRSSLRTWVFRIATNACLTHLEGRKRRPLPTGLGAPAADARDEPRAEVGVSWLEPVPDDLLWAQGPPDPAAQAVSRDSVRLAFVAALQHLTAQQRAVLLLRDVLAWRAREVAEALDITVAGVNSTLQRARARLSDIDPDVPPRLPDDERHRRLLHAYIAAFEAYDVGAIVDLLAADVVWEMPPFPEWYRGAEEVGTLISTWCPAQRPGDMKVLPTSANGDPVLAVYMREEDGVHRAFHLQHVTAGEAGVARVTAFFAPELFAQFGLPPELPVR